MLAGSPLATISELIVSPARAAASPVVQSVTAPPSRPRNLRIGSGSGSAKGCVEWMVIAAP